MSFSDEMVRAILDGRKTVTRRPAGDASRKSGECPIGGPGGQHQNKTDSGVRIRHPESGAVGEARDNRSQHANRRTAFRRLVNSPEFQTWLRRKAAEAMTDKRALMRRVEEQMRPENVRVEVMQNGKWTKEKAE